MAITEQQKTNLLGVTSFMFNFTQIKHLSIALKQLSMPIPVFML